MIGRVFRWEAERRICGQFREVGVCAGGDATAQKQAETDSVVS